MARAVRGELTPCADTLDQRCARTAGVWPIQEIPLLDVGLRTHEILENALEFQLTGHDDYGSGSTLATTAANITAHARAAVPAASPARPRYPGLPAVYTGLDRLQALLDKEQLRRTGRGFRVAPADRGPSAIDAACGQVLQELAPIASIAEPRNTANDF